MSATTGAGGRGPFTRALLDGVVAAVRPELGGVEPVDVRTSDAHSNPMAELRFADGRSLMVKRARYAWAGARFTASRLAAKLLRVRTELVAPRHVALPPELDPLPLEAYWRVPLPTLETVWPSIPRADRPAVLRGWGALLRRVHQVALPGHGPLDEAVRGTPTLSAFLRTDLEERLLPAVAEAWTEGVDTVEALVSAIPTVTARTGAARLLHNDLHMGNVLCEVGPNRVRCVGALDLEAAFAGPVEADLAHTALLHGPLFGHPLPGGWLAHFREGYGEPGDPFALAFFRTYHLVNLGFHAALAGMRAHAHDVADAAARAAADLTPPGPTATFLAG